MVACEGRWHGFPPANATETRSGRIGIAAAAAAVAMDATLALAVGDGAPPRRASAMMATIGLAAKTARRFYLCHYLRANTIARLVVSWLRWRWIPWSPRGDVDGVASGGVCRAGMGSAGGEGGDAVIVGTHTYGGRCALVGRGDRGGNCRDSFCRGRQVRATRARASGEGGVMKFRQSVKRHAALLVLLGIKTFERYVTLSSKIRNGPPPACRLKV